jgi:TonB family protein
MLALVLALLVQDAAVTKGPAEASATELRLHPGAVGGATLRCMAQPDGRVTDCEVLREIPEGQGYGRAAVVTSRRTRVNPATFADPSVPRQIQFNMYFDENVDPASLADVPSAPEG